MKTHADNMIKQISLEHRYTKPIPNSQDKNIQCGINLKKKKYVTPPCPSMKIVHEQTIFNDKGKRISAKKNL